MQSVPAFATQSVKMTAFASAAAGNSHDRYSGETITATSSAYPQIHSFFMANLSYSINPAAVRPPDHYKRRHTHAAHKDHQRGGRALQGRRSRGRITCMRLIQQIEHTTSCCSQQWLLCTV